MFEVVTRKRTCILCGKIIKKGIKAFIYRFTAWNASKRIDICADHFKFKDCEKCSKKMVCATSEGRREGCYISKQMIKELDKL